MAQTTLGGLFSDRRRGDDTLAELKKAGFASAQISQVADDANTPAAKELSDPTTDFLADHITTGSEFRDNLTSLGMADANAHYFEDGVARGGALVTVKVDARESEIRAIFARNGADLGLQGRSTPPPANAPLSDQTLQLHAERLSIEKVRVASGEARIRKEIIVERQSIDVPVSHEELVIERHPVTGAAFASGAIGTDQTITIPLSREEVKVGKQTFITEEVQIGKRAVGETEKVSETVRHEELVVGLPGAPKPATPPR